MLKNNKHKIIVAVTGASGAIYAHVLLNKLLLLKEQIDEVGMVMSDNAKKVWEHELGNKKYTDYPFSLYEKNDFFAPFASGSANYDSMIVCPCSMGTLSRIAHGVSDCLITRAADVILKEKRKLILVSRESPLSLIHINNMKTVAEAGGIICPASPSFYSQPLDIESLVSTIIDRVLSLLKLEINRYRWGN